MTKSPPIEQQEKPINVVIPGITENIQPSVNKPAATPAPSASPAANPPVEQPNPLAAKPNAEITQKPEEVKVEAPKIDTDVLGNSPDPATKKTPAQFAEERRKSKEQELEQKFGVPELKQTIEQVKADNLRIEMELRDIKLERDKLAQEKEQNELLAKQRKEELDKATGSYFDAFRAEAPIEEDRDFIESTSRFNSTLASSLPERIPIGDDEKRIFPEQLLSNPTFAGQMDNVMSHFAYARSRGDSVTMDLAVNAAAQLLGVPMVIDPDPTKCQGTLESGDPVFRQIESAMKGAMPHWGTRNERVKALREQAPVLIQQKLLERERTISGNIKAAIFMQPDEAQARLRANPSDTSAVLATIIESTPELKEMVERTVAGLAPAFARMGKIDMPTLSEKTPEAIKAHQDEALAYRARLADAMPAAVLGKIAGPVIASLIGQLKSANQRLAGVAVNTNPGSVELGREPAAPAVKIATDI